ncbi:hypothetical protein SAMN05660284_02431 [Formivibrio citricus]|uniref:Carboxypeptidase regulatory-like domain-containing protein n=1 Tax=Formivibrio citricus TaxID=83765 RepID=A0A1I5CL91_9NEIS|nr:carboxypeptidase-like regulatory domain-containing protein [Formivibrio citricus]SFN87780.1 hypothetical protein SAMN05660284_02431 [Formivibrio citricus]
MKIKPVFFSALLGAALLTLPGISSAQDPVEITPQRSPAGIEYVMSSVGEDQQNAMAAIRKDYNFHLTFARPKSGEFLADVKVTVETVKKEKVLEVVSEGPYLFAKLPAGTYKVTAEFEGKSQTKTTTIRKNRSSDLVYYFAEQ